MSIDEREEWANALDTLIERLQTLSSDLRDDEYNTDTRSIIERLDERQKELAHLVSSLKELF